MYEVQIMCTINIYLKKKKLQIYNNNNINYVIE